MLPTVHCQDGSLIAPGEAWVRRQQEERYYQGKLIYACMSTGSTL